LYAPKRTKNPSPCQTPLSVCPLALSPASGYNPAMTTSPECQAALDYIYSFVDYSRTHQQNLAPENFDLRRMRALLERLGNPQDRYKTIHIAGTKGKGSVSAFCATALQEAGYKTGLYTSPHLRDFTERIQIDHAPIPEDALAALVEEIKPHVAAIPRLTTFEITTALAFWYFARQRVEAAVIEVGLGGRLDATNLITPQVSVITSISKDHTCVLGDTLGEIAAEKGGIIKPGVPVVLAPQRSEPREILRQIAAERGCPLTQVGADYKFSIKSRALDGQVVSIWRPNGAPGEPVLLKIGLLGDHQAENAATAYAALHVAGETGLSLSERDIRRGLEETAWPGRFEVLESRPVPLIVDAAHNPYSANALRNALDQYFPARPLVLIVGFSADKDVPAMLNAWLPHARQVIATQSGHPRAMPPGEIAAVVRKISDLPVTTAPDAAAALAEARRLASEDDLILGTGSIFLAASVRIAALDPQ